MRVSVVYYILIRYMRWSAKDLLWQRINSDALLKKKRKMNACKKRRIDDGDDDSDTTTDCSQKESKLRCVPICHQFEKWVRFNTYCAILFCLFFFSFLVYEPANIFLCNTHMCALSLLRIHCLLFWVFFPAHFKYKTSFRMVLAFVVVFVHIYIICFLSSLAYLIWKWLS